VRAISDEYRRATMGTLRLAFLSALVLDLLSMIAMAVVAVGIGLRLVGGDVSFATALFVLILTPEAFAPMRALGATFHASADGLAAMDAVERVLSQPRPARGSGPAPAGGALEITDLWVRRPERPHPTPAGFALRVEPGEFVAITGPSGAGKSTVFAALLGFVEPDAGRITVGGVPQADVDEAAWRRQFAWLPQAPYLLAGDVRGNIAMGRPDATEAEIADAARRAALDVPLDAAIADGGTGLSAGQRRRVGLARVLLRDAPFLLLDEPTAGLDQDTEARIVETLRSSKRAVIAIAHRPAVIAAADRCADVTPHGASAEVVAAVIGAGA
jgi:ABC-type transport system involved in cytochrome bd biosynthesis fused ATPase/permease subunit